MIIHSNDYRVNALPGNSVQFNSYSTTEWISSTTCYFFCQSALFLSERRMKGKAWWKCYQNSSVCSLALNIFPLSAQHVRSHLTVFLFSLCNTNIWIIYDGNCLSNHTLKHKIQIVPDLLFASLIKNDNSICAFNWVSGRI